MKNKQQIQPVSSATSNFVLYTAPDGKVKLEVFLQAEMLWLTQKMMAELFDVAVHTINYHLKNIFNSAELSKEATIRRIRIVQNENGRVEAAVIRKIRITAIDGKAYNTLTGKGQLSKNQADPKALSEYQEFNKKQPIESDFEKQMAKILKNTKKSD